MLLISYEDALIMFKKCIFQINAVLLNFSKNPETYISQFLTQE